MIEKKETISMCVFTYETTIWVTLLIYTRHKGRVARGTICEVPNLLFFPLVWEVSTTSTWYERLTIENVVDVVRQIKLLCFFFPLSYARVFADLFCKSIPLLISMCVHPCLFVSPPLFILLVIPCKTRKAKLKKIMLGNCIISFLIMDS